jgi:streptomycin 6-kinase
LLLPDSLKEIIERVHGEKGRQWLTTLPSLLVECCERWRLELDRPFDNLSYNLVIPGRTKQGADIVLKLGVPCSELVTEAGALSLFGGVGAVRVLDQDVARGALLMERAVPGALLYELQGDSEATATAAQVMRRLWREPPEGHSFPSLAIWFRAFGQLRSRFKGDSGPFPNALFAKAERTFLDLNASCERQLILHGDLHHANILSSARDGWVAIDPKGIFGDPGYEVGSFMLNQLPQSALDSALIEILDQRLSIFSDELQIRRERLAGWAFCHAVLSAVWSFEESSEWHETISLARLLEQLL